MYEEIIQLISNVGFPIVAFLLMYKMTTDTLEKNTTALAKLSEVINRLELKLDLLEKK